MPLVRITFAQGSSAAVQRAVADGVHRALVETANVPADDRFQVLEEVPADSLIFSPSYLGIERRGPVVFVQVFLNQGRTVAVKQALYARIAAELSSGAGLRKEDVLVNLVEVSKENWSFGNGLMSYPPAP
jgi:phenylpyruvate tautomerase PptA (4-oxalocrotonate tautomerase family)